MKQGSEELIFAAALTAFLILAGTVVLPSFIGARNTSSQNVCVNNLRQIDGAKRYWALRYHKATNDIPTWAEIQPLLGRGPQAEIPKCPQGGTYILGRIGELPRCSIGGPGHSLHP